MESMVVPAFESLDRRPFEQFGPWPRGDRKQRDGDMEVELGTALLHVTARAIPALTDQLLHGPKSSKEAGWRRRPTHEEAVQANSMDSRSSGLSKLEQTLSAFTESQIGEEDGADARDPDNDGRSSLLLLLNPGSPERELSPFSTPTPTQPDLPRRTLKRRRPDSDVDGPDTASLGCKKRRLLRHLITSRLSQPFSLPATHILNRESIATGDKRFLKLAAIMTARRLNSAVLAPTQLNHPSPSSMLRRAAVINRFRLRVRKDAAERGDQELAHIAANSSLLLQSQGIGMVIGGRFPVASPTGNPGMPQASGVSAPGVGMAGPIPPRPYTPHTLPQAQAPHIFVRPAIEHRMPVPMPMPTSPTSPGLRLQTSPRMRPVRSPELRTTRPMTAVSFSSLDDFAIDHDDEDDDCVAFPTSELESRYEVSDDPDDPYADFDVIFGGGSDGGPVEAEESDDEPDHYEEYMDDLDGIPWTAR